MSVSYSNLTPLCLYFYRVGEFRILKIEVQATTNFTRSSVPIAGEDLCQTAPKRKRKCLTLQAQVRSTEERGSCRNCKCKISNYCDAFATGVYCTEPCLCLECLNKPINDDTVLQTRRKIESCNSHVFFPKVIRSSVYFLFNVAVGGDNDCPEIRKCEMAILREMQKSKKQKIQEILDAEDASVEANRVFHSTNGFSDSNLLGHGTYVSNYCELSFLSRMTAAKTKEFMSEIKFLCKVHHTNLVELVGYAANHDDPFLIYGSKGSTQQPCHSTLTWTTRVQIVVQFFVLKQGADLVFPVGVMMKDLAG
ncbi:tesmin/TSO1-like CXC domain protein, putative [Medicago truncatula]|uniref:Tesmin/TSO1-like CXC domain protein, putative n=1 Tax=Medicago truncatula TaxID=3880 RepID=A0A072V6Z4_MEDTR|nr:tesmin/TSO1-like CXC domain protein, putative [Medicago truncatula]